MRRFLSSWMLAALLALAIVVAPAPTTAAELAGVTMDDSVEMGDATLVLNGLGLRKKIGFKVYVGGLYLTEKSSDAAAILAADAPRRTVMEFMRGVSSKQLCGAWNDCLEGNNPGASDDLTANFGELCAMMEDVRKGDRMVAAYSPAEGTAISMGETAKGTLAGKDFADALFACWIGDKPATEDLKSGMLGQ